MGLEFAHLSSARHFKAVRVAQEQDSRVRLLA